MKKSSVLTLICLLVLVLGSVTFGKPVCVGVFKDNRSCGVEGVAKTLQKQGYKTRVLARKDIQDKENLKDVDVIYLPGGWNGINFAGFHGRMNLVDFVAQGKGILAGAFRSGWFRTANRPLLPQVGYTFFKSNAMYIFPRGDSPLVKGIDEPCYTANWDTMQARAGPNGKVFAVDSSGIPVGVYGEIYGGRYVILGDFIHMNDEEMPDTGLTKLFLNCIQWLAAAPGKTPDIVQGNRKIAEEDFLRRDLKYDWLHNETGPDNAPGVIPGVWHKQVTRLYSKLWQMEYFAGFVPENQDMSAALTELRGSIEAINRNYETLVARNALEIGGMSLEELRAEHILLRDREELKASVADVAGDDKNRLLRSIDRGRIDSKRLISLMDETRITEDLLNGINMDSVISNADKTIADLKPDAIAARDAEITGQARKDKAAVPALLKQLSSGRPEERTKAARELGRIGDKRAVAGLIRTLDSDDEDLLVNSIQALSWMQAREAVPELCKLLDNENKWIRRRAAQALGQIGDRSAVDALLPLLQDPDYHVKQNVVFALGWLKADKAVPELIELLNKGDMTDPYQRDTMIMVARALGHIGNSKAVPVLKELGEKAADFPGKARRGTGRHINIYSIGTTLGVQGHAELALQEIASGGLREPGIKQPEFLTRRDKFSPFKDNFNFLAGRPYCGANRYFENDTDGLFAYVRSMGANGIHCAWDISRQLFTPEEYKQILEIADDYDLKWIETMPALSSCVFHAPRHEKVKGNGSLLCKATAENIIMAYTNVSSFQGFWYEECWPRVQSDDPDVRLRLKSLLKERYGADYLDVVKWDGVSQIEQPGPDADTARQKLWAAFLEVAGDSTIEEWKESQQWLHGLRKGCAFTWNESVGHKFAYIGNFANAGAAIAMAGPESYLAFDPDSVLAMELFKDGQARPVLCEFYNWYDPTDRHTELGYVRQLMHGECFFNFDLAQLSKAPAVYMYYYGANRQEIATRVFTKAQKLKQYLAGAASAANVALVASERSRVLFYSLKIGESICMPRRYYQQLLAFWEGLRQLGVPADAIWAETLSPEKLERYSVLILPDGKSLTPHQVQVLADWVEKGGVLIATGSTSLCDENGLIQDDYALGNVFGVNYVKHGAMANPKDSDTYCFVRGEPPAKVQNEGFERTSILRCVHRETKPVKSIGLYDVETVSDFLPGMYAGFACEYDMPLGYDVVKPGNAEVLAKFKNGDPAVTVNRHGKGICYLWTPVYPGLCHNASEFVYSPGHFSFWPGVINVLDAMIRGGMEYENDMLPVEIISGPVDDVEITVRKQPESNRWVVHLVNCNTRLEYVKSLNLVVRPPATKKNKVFYPGDGAGIDFAKSGSGIAFSVRDFAVHEMVVVEY